MILGKDELEKIHQQHTVATPLASQAIQTVHIDLRLGNTLIKYIAPIDLRKKPESQAFTIDNETGYTLAPGDFVIASTYEQVHIPAGHWGFVETKGNIARAGLSAHNTDGHIDPGYKGVITLEVQNTNTVPVTIYPKLPFVQLFLFEVKGNALLYNGKYQNSTQPTVFLPDTAHQGK